MTALSGRELDEALTELGWLDMLDEMPETAIPLVFRLLGETGAHAPVLNDVVLRAARRAGGGPPAAAIHRRLLCSWGTPRPGRLNAGRRPADTPRAPGRSDTSRRGPPRSRLVASRRRPHDGVPCAPT